MKQIEALKILQSGKNVFLTGEPGAGKTYTIERFVEWMEKTGKRYAITASTGIAAAHINGATIHSWSGLGIKRNLSKDELDDIVWNKWVVKRVKKTDILVIDEVSMIDAVLLDDLNKILKGVRKDQRAFGGLQIVLVGDFFQLPPVTRGGDQVFAFEADAWAEADLTICYLTEQHRQEDQEFLDILGAMRTGTTTEAHKDRLVACQTVDVPDTQLFTHNADVDALNQSELAKLEGKPKTYRMSQWGAPAVIETLKRNCLSPETLVLKVGAVVMFTRNNPKAGYVNGTIGKVVKFQKGNNSPVVKLLNGRSVEPEMAEWTFEEEGKAKAGVEQLPLRLAWAITVHKSQGMSLDSAKINLEQTFEFGQGYVAISRVRSLAGLHLEGVNDRVFMTHPKVAEKDLEFRSVGV